MTPDRFMETICSLWWRTRLVYHMRKCGMYKRRLGAIKHAWRESAEEHWQQYYEVGASPADAIVEDYGHA